MGAGRGRCAVVHRRARSPRHPGPAPRPDVGRGNPTESPACLDAVDRDRGPADGTCACAGPPRQPIARGRRSLDSHRRRAACAARAATHGDGRSAASGRPGWSDRGAAAADPVRRAPAVPSADPDAGTHPDARAATDAGADRPDDDTRSTPGGSAAPRNGYAPTRPHARTDPRRRFFGRRCRQRRLPRGERERTGRQSRPRARPRATGQSLRPQRLGHDCPVARPKLGFRPFSAALIVWDVWRRLPPRQRRWMLLQARLHGPKLVRQANEARKARRR